MTSYCKWPTVYLVFLRGKCRKGMQPLTADYRKNLFTFQIFILRVLPKCDSYITKCDGLLLKSATSVITKCDRTTFQSRRVTQIWLHACGYGKDVHGAVEFSCTLITKGTEKSNTLRLSYCSFTAE